MEFENESSFRLPRGFIYLCIVREGKLEMLGGKATPIGPGDVLVLNTDGCAQPRFVPRTAVCVQLLPMKAESFYPLFAGGEISKLQLLLGLSRPLIVHQAGTSIARACDELFSRIDRTVGLLERAVVLAVFAKALSSSPGKCGEPKRPKHEKLLEALPGLTSADLMTLAVGQIASRYHMSRRHLSRIFHENFGISIATVKMEIRLIQAVRLLRWHELKVIEVAERTGFNHLGLFNTCFKRRFGMSPTKYRANLKARVVVDGALEACPLKAAGLCAWMSGEETPQTGAFGGGI